MPLTTLHAWHRFITVAGALPALLMAFSAAQAACTIPAPTALPFDGPCNASGLPDGTGRYRLDNGMEIVTTFRQGVADATGAWELGPFVFRGPLQHGLPNGLWQAQTDGLQWRIGFERGQPHGEARATLPDGGELALQLKHGQFDGLASVRYPGGIQFVGKFQGGLPHGEWIAQLPGGGAMRTHFDQGVARGEARIDMGDDQGLSGRFERGMLHGPGRIWFARGFELRGTLEQNVPVGRWTSPPGSDRDLTVNFTDRQMNGHGDITLHGSYRLAGPISQGLPSGTWRSPPDATMPLEVTFTDKALNGHWVMRMQGQEFTGPVQRGIPIIHLDGSR